MFKNRLKDFLRYYIEAKNIDDLEALEDAMLAEQFLETLPAEVRQFVVSKQPVNSEQRCEFADLYSEVARNANKPDVLAGKGGPGSSKTQANGSALGKNATVNAGKGSEMKMGPKRCYVCYSTEHGWFKCPYKQQIPICKKCGVQHPQAVSCYNCIPQYVGTTAVCLNSDACLNDDCVNCGTQNAFVVPVTINGQFTMALRDTGNFAPTLVDPRLVKPQNYTGQHIMCKGAFADQCLVPLAVVEMSSQALGCDRDVQVLVGVSTIPDGFMCNIGNSVFQEYSCFTDIFRPVAGDAKFQILAPNTGSRNAGQTRELEQHKSLVAAVTRAAARRQPDREINFPPLGNAHRLTATTGAGRGIGLNPTNGLSKTSEVVCDSMTDTVDPQQVTGAATSSDRPQTQHGQVGDMSNASPDSDMTSTDIRDTLPLTQSDAPVTDTDLSIDSEFQKLAEIDTSDIKTDKPINSETNTAAGRITETGATETQDTQTLFDRQRDVGEAASTDKSDSFACAF